MRLSTPPHDRHRCRTDYECIMKRPLTRAVRVITTFRCHRRVKHIMYTIKILFKLLLLSEDIIRATATHHVEVYIYIYM